jgi:2-polyprenyl-3-methyl-5-hydroxy-6-metoxy-1,4-benzoquinol methylase
MRTEGPREKLHAAAKGVGSRTICAMTAIPGFFQGTEMPDPGWWKAFWPDPAKVLASTGLIRGVEAIDLCSGDGWFTLPMAKVARHVFAIDIDRKLLDAARMHLENAGVTSCTFIEGDAYDIASLVPRSVDFVFLANAFHGVPEPTRLARAVAGALNPHGHFAIVNWHRRPREETKILGEPRGPATALRMTPEATAAAVEPADLKLREIVEVPPYHYGAIFEKLAD